MDFTRSESQVVVGEVAADALAQIGYGDDDAGWAALVSSDLLTNFAPEAAGGDGLGAVDAVELFIAVGRTGLDLPAVGNLAVAAVLDRFGTPGQCARHLPGIVAGRDLYPLAIAEPAADGIQHGHTSAVETPGGWRLDGVKVGVGFADRATRLVVTATLNDDTPGVFLIDPAAPGVTLGAEVATTGATRWTVDLDGVTVPGDDAMMAPGAAAAVQRHALLYLSALQVGCAGRALELAASYTSQREQFGRPVATFQAVATRLADAHIDLQALRWAVYDAAHAVANDRADAELSVAVAKFWAADAGHRIVSTAQHVHGGIGVDTDYPLHRFFLCAKDIEFALGGASAQLATVWAELSARVTR